MTVSPLVLQADSSGIIVTGARCVYKTEAFLRATARFSSVDPLLSLLAESVFSYGYERERGRGSLATTEENGFSFFFVFTEKGDLVFYKFLTAGGADRTNDLRIADFLQTHKTFLFTLRPVEDAPRDEEMKKLYLLSGDDKVHLPLLNPVQQSIVETEDKNVLVQGVAGSGKTNVCVEKIVYCASRGYRGRILYTTYSRGLLIETKKRVLAITQNVERFADAYAKKKVVFLDRDHKKAIENKLGILFTVEEDEKLLDSLVRIASFLRQNVDYYLIEDLYATKFPPKAVAFEREFLHEYLSDNKRVSGVYERVKHLSPEIIYKEIYGMIFGKYDVETGRSPNKETYIAERRDAFTPAECESIWLLAQDYERFLFKSGYADNNTMSRELLSVLSSPLYSVGIADEVQDFTEINLVLLKTICRKLFCVGDALQMINPSYFSFGYLKRLLYGEVTGVTELTHNYRNAKTIENIVEKIGDLNVRRFGTHRFVLRGESVDEGSDASAVYVRSKRFIGRMAEKRFENLTVIVSGTKEKDALRALLKKTEILTVSEAKGLERNAVILYDVLSSDQDKWHRIETAGINRKTADENSVFRYYFNLFYVGVSRAKQYLVVVESEEINYFKPLFDECFEQKDDEQAVAFLTEVAGKTELDDDELVARIAKFCELGQYENAYFTADRLSDGVLCARQKNIVYVYETYLSRGDYRGAGVEYWKRGMDEDAKDAFRLSGDEDLIPLVDACRGSGKSLDVSVVRFLPLVRDNPVAVRLIADTVKGDLQSIMDTQKEINRTLKGQRSKK